MVKCIAGFVVRGFLEERYLRDDAWKPKATLLLEKKSKLCLMISFEKDIDLPSLPEEKAGYTEVGIDRGACRRVPLQTRPEIRGSVVVFHRPFLFYGGEVKQKWCVFLEARSRLQRKGTRSPGGV